MRGPTHTDTIESLAAKGHKVHTRSYDSMGEFLSDLERSSMPSNRFGRGESGADWHGARNFAEGCKLIRNGISKFNERINSLVDKVSVELPSTQDAWVADVAGCAPIVPAAIAGLPDNMLRLEQQETSGVPLRIFVSTAYSGGCSQKLIEERGIAILALLQSLAAKRPVELLLFAEFDDATYRGFRTPIVRVDSMPLDQTTLTAALVSPVVSRMMFMGWCQKEPGGFGGAWAWNGDPTQERDQALTREALGANRDDLVIFAAYLTQQDKIIKDPVGWVKEQVALTEKGVNEG